MYLKELRINGFKSFADRTKLEFSPGITAIVGPNGCGKSNTSDAIRWVLGEQSAKSLRAGAMHDVIFQGTDTRKPLNMCEVSLVFADCEDQLGTAYNEVEITRRVQRDGGSSYYLNGKACRLKDIQRLFMDTGVGQVSYSFMVQGQIDQILSSNPSERRIIFEEAAGITRYKSQRREALLKLTQVEANLARVTDVIDEVSRQIGSLKRQAAKALRYKKIKHRLTHLELAFGGFRYHTLSAEVKRLEGETTALRNDTTKLREGLKEKEDQLTNAKERQKALMNSMQHCQQQVYELRSERETAENQGQLSETRIQDLEGRKQNLRNDIQELENLKQEINEKISGTEKAKGEQLELFGSSDEHFREQNQALEDLQGRLEEAEREVQQLRQNLLMTESKLTRLRSNCTTLEVEMRTSQVKHSGLAEEAFRLKEEEEVQRENLNEILATLEERRTQLARRESDIQKLRAEESELSTQFRNIQKVIQEEDRNLARHTAQVNILEDLQNRFEGFGEGTKAVLKGKLEETLPPDDLQVLSKVIQVEEDYTGAVELLMGQLSEAIFLPAESSEHEIQNKIQSTGIGKVPFIRAERSAPQEIFNAEGPLTPVIDKITVKEFYQSRVENLLEGCFLANSFAEVHSWLKTNPDQKYRQIATRDGVLIDGRGVIVIASASRANDSVLQRTNEIKRLKTEQIELQKKVDAARTQANTIQAKLDEAESVIEDNRGLLDETRQEVTILQEQERSAQNILRQTEARRIQIQNEIDNLDGQKESAEEQLESARRQLNEAEQEIESFRVAINQAEQKVQEIRTERDNRKEGMSQVRLDLAEKRQKLELLDRNIREGENQLRELATRKKRAEDEIGELDRQIVQLRQQSEHSKIRADEVQGRINEVMRQLDEIREASKLVENAVSELENQLGLERGAASEKLTRLNQLEIKFAQEESKLKFIIEELTREYEVEPERIGWKVELWKAGDILPERIRVEIDDDEEGGEVVEERGEPTDEDLESVEEPDWRMIEVEIKNLRSRISSMGPVNLVAIDEYNELKERYEFLKTQSDDLWNAKEQLIAAIDDINKTSQELFRNTFDQIKKNFAYTFETLFGGGHSDLNLVDNEDVLESGIEITARPPGTKLKTLALLSGGQKTMTAVALLFAIYMVKPSPFCLLDELDAPLDDANVGRFTDIVKKFTEYSQFILITHNKRTISAAGTIYGVTMQEKGVSKIVSMRFNRDTGNAESEEGVPLVGR